MNFFNNKIILIRENIQHSTDSSSAAGIIQAVISPDVCLESFHPIDLHKLTTTLSPSKSSTFILDPIPTRLLKEVWPLIINWSLVTGYVPQSFKVAVIKPHLKKNPTLVPEAPANYRPISNLPFLSKILEKTVAKQLRGFLQYNHLFEEFQDVYLALSYAAIGLGCWGEYSLRHWALFLPCLTQTILFSSKCLYPYTKFTSSLELLCFIILQVFPGHGGSCWWGPAWCLLATSGQEILWLDPRLDFHCKLGYTDYNGFWVNRLYLRLDHYISHIHGFIDST